MNCIPNVRKSTQTFVNVLQKAEEWFASLSKMEQQNLIDESDHGAGHLTNIRQLNAYIAKYGEISQTQGEGSNLRLVAVDDAHSRGSVL